MQDTISNEPIVFVGEELIQDIATNVLKRKLTKDELEELSYDMWENEELYPLLENILRESYGN